MRLGSALWEGVGVGKEAGYVERVVKSSAEWPQPPWLNGELWGLDLTASPSQMSHRWHPPPPPQEGHDAGRGTFIEGVTNDPGHIYQGPVQWASGVFGQVFLWTVRMKKGQLGMVQLQELTFVEWDGKYF